jgi:hypothetical protein
LRGEPAGKENGGRSESRSEIDSHFLNFGKMMMRGRMIEELGECEANLIQARPIQIAKHDALSCFLLSGLDQVQLRAKILPSLAVVDDAIDPRPKLRIHRLTQFFLPPEVEGQVGIQVRENNAR